MDRLGDAPPDARLGLDRPPRELARAQARRRLGRPQPADQQPGRERRYREQGLVEREHSAGDGYSVQQRRGGDECHDCDRRHQQATRLAEQVCVRRDEEERDEPDARIRLRFGDLDEAEHDEVHDRDDGAERQVGAFPGEPQRGSGPRQCDRPQRDHHPRLVRDVEDDHRRERRRREHQPHDRKPENWLARLDGQPPRDHACRRSTRTQAAAMPTASMATSTGVPCRPCTKVWWYSSVAA